MPANDLSPTFIQEIPLASLTGVGAGGTATQVTIVDLTIHTGTWPTTPSGRDVTAWLYSGGGGGGSGNGTDGGSGGAPGAFAVVTIPAAISAMGGSYVLGAAGTGGVHGGSAATAGATCKITLGGTDVLTLTGGGAGGLSGSSPAAGGVATVDSSITLLAKSDGVPAPTSTLTPAGWPGGQLLSPGAGAGGTPGTGAGNGGNGGNESAGGGGGGATGNGGNGGGPKIVIMYFP